MASSTAPTFNQATADSVALFDSHPGMSEDQLEIQCLNGIINVTNISGADLNGDILIYYKNNIGDIFYGGITYRLRIEGGLKAGWNTVVLKLDSLNSVGEPIEWNSIKYFRIYNQPKPNGGEFTTGDKGLTMALDNIRFTKGGQKVVAVSEISAKMNGWDTEWYVAPTVVNGYKSLTQKTKDKKFALVNIHFHYRTQEAIDLTGMKYVEFDLYISDVDPLLDKVNLQLELNSTGEWDQKEIGFTDKKIGDLGLVDGWNHLKFALDDLKDTAGTGEFDLTEFRWFRLFTVETVNDLPEDIVINLTNVRFTTDKAPECPLCNEKPHEVVLPGPESGLVDFPWGTPNFELNKTTSAAITWAPKTEVKFCDIYIEQ
jgi:hypothetical protein